MISGLSSSAKQLLNQLREGEGSDIGVPSVYAGAMAFSSHAEAYFSNAARLCEEPDAHDFCVFGALYGIRHGLELWLKALLINNMIDDALESIVEGACCSEKVAHALKLDSKQKQHQFRSLCILRNACEDGLVYPECVEKNIDPSSADRAVCFIRQNGHLEWYKLAYAWTVPTPGHGIQELWAKVRQWVEELHPAVSAHASYTGCGSPMSREELGAVCELVHHWDPGGDTFRYPLALDGRWNIGLPALSLKALGELARSLQGTALGYESLLTESYGFSKLRSPRPNVSYL